jgi:hypothetical protein
MVALVWDVTFPFINRIAFNSESRGRRGVRFQASKHSWDERSLAPPSTLTRRSFSIIVIIVIIIITIIIIIAAKQLEWFRWFSSYL